jgi:POT family proton-dependent oligopeptide transporter
MAKTKIKLSDFPAAFWAANTMEIFERMAWYGFFAVSSLYISGSVEEGGLGFSHEDRGVLQGVVTFFLYLFPVVSGTLADRYGFKKVLFAAYLILTPAYYLLGQFTSFPTFFLAYMLVAVGAGTFKPVIIGTISKTTDDRTSSMGFGIFYMMVNIGGFVGPIVAGIVRGWSWDYVFVASAIWISINFLILAIFYKDPVEVDKTQNRKLKDVFGGMVEVLGNGRFFIFVFGLLVILVMGSKFTADETFTWMQIIWMVVIWSGINVAFDLFLKKNRSAEKAWFRQPMKLGDWRFGLFLLLMSGFWTSFNQIFYTLNLYIQDFVDTSDLMNASVSVLTFFGFENFVDTFRNSMAHEGQMNPEYIINVNALGIILFQVLVSYLVTRLKPFTTIFWGTIITVLSFTVLIFGTTGWIVIAGLLIFSFGEMMASPKSKEYTGKIAPPDKVAMYMGYFYWCVALGNLFGGILSGQFYALFAIEMNRPDLMWLTFALIALGTAMLVWLYDKFVIKRIKH